MQQIKQLYPNTYMTNCSNCQHLQALLMHCNAEGMFVRTRVLVG